MYGAYIILLIMKFMQKLTQEALIVILPVLMAISFQQSLPLPNNTLVIVCLIYSMMGFLALFVNKIIGRLDIEYQDRSILLFSIFASAFGVFF